MVRVLFTKRLSSSPTRADIFIISGTHGPDELPRHSLFGEQRSPADSEREWQLKRFTGPLMLRPLFNTIYLSGSRGVLFSSLPVFFPFGSRFASNLKGTPLVNNDIPYTYVRVVDPETRKLSPPRPLAEVIDNLATEVQSKQGGGPPKTFVTQFAQLVAPPSGATNGYALVKLVDRREAAAREKTQRVKAQASRKASEEKEIQFAWNIGVADVQHKLRKTRQELERGVRVQLVFARKGTGGPERDSGTRAKQNAFVAQVVEELTDVAREWRMRDERRNMVVVYLQDHRRSIPHKSLLAKQATKQAVSSTHDALQFP